MRASSSATLASDWFTCAASCQRTSLDESDVVVFGHSHLPLIDRQAEVLWVNPGSATQPRRSPIGRSVALLEIAEDGAADARIVPLSEFGEGR